MSRRLHPWNLLLSIFMLLFSSNMFAQLQLTVSMSTTASCGNSGTATATVSNGTPPYTYTWYDNIGNAYPNASSITGLPGGDYYVQVQDQNQWYGWAQGTVAHPFQMTLTTTDDVCFAGIGTATAGVTSGGTPPFTYLWSNGATTPMITGLTTGTYEVTVTDAAGCFVESVADSNLVGFVGNSSPITFSLTGVGSTCTNGTATIGNIAGGTPPYNYVWGTTPQQFTLTATNIPGSSWVNVSVTDAAGCLTVNGIWINQLPNGLNATMTTTPETCLQSNGSASVVVSGGTAPYTYLWSNGATTPSISGLPYGNYAVTITDANNCPKIKVGTVHRTSPVIVSLSSVNPACNNTSGSLTAAVSGGTPPYTYQWSNGATTASISGLSAGWYSVGVADANGCQAGAYRTLVIPSTCLGTVSGYVLGDPNANCIYDGGDFPFQSRIVTLGANYAFSNQQGYYYKHLFPGSYTVSQPIAPTYFAQNCPVSPNTYTVTNLAPQQMVSNLDFFNLATSVVNDLEVYSYATPARATAPQHVTIFWYNRGSTTQNAVVNYTHDALMTLINGGGMTSYNLGTRTLTYNLGNVYPGQSGILYCEFTIPNTTPLGTAYSHSVEILPNAGDATPLDNQMVYSNVTVAAYDPNDKSVTPDGLLATTDSMLTYRIRFQNTGTDTATTVIIKDTLDPSLDITSLELMGASHAYVPTADVPGVLTFTFDNIMLPDSFIDEPNSHGYIIYRIKLKDNLALGTDIRNRAAIYFDFNPPIITNTTLNTYGLVAIDDQVDAASFTLSPNPAQNRVAITLGESWSGQTAVNIKDLSGKLLQTIHVDPAQGRVLDLGLQPYAKGVYFVECVNDNFRQVRKLVLQ